MLDMCQFLASQEADARRKNKHGYSALLLAARCGQASIVEYLLQVRE